MCVRVYSCVLVWFSWRGSRVLPPDDFSTRTHTCAHSNGPSRTLPFPVEEVHAHDCCRAARNFTNRAYTYTQMTRTHTQNPYSGCRHFGRKMFQNQVQNHPFRHHGDLFQNLVQNHPFRHHGDFFILPLKRNPSTHPPNRTENVGTLAGKVPKSGPKPPLPPPRGLPHPSPLSPFGEEDGGLHGCDGEKAGVLRDDAYV